MRRRDDRGLVLPSWLVALSAMLVALALVSFGVSGDREPEVDAGSDATVAGADAGSPERTEPSAGKGSSGTKAAKRPDRNKKRPKGKAQQVPPDRRAAYVEVYNASAITGLAAQTTAELRDTGWQVVATDNWYGEIPASTVYYPGDLAGQARLLAADLGVERVLPAVEPMSFDRLTVVLTGAA